MAQEAFENLSTMTTAFAILKTSKSDFLITSPCRRNHGRQSPGRFTIRQCRSTRTSRSVGDPGGVLL